MTNSIETKTLLAALKFCAPAMAKKDVRYYLCGLSIQSKAGYDHITLQASDGHRVHQIKARTHVRVVEDIEIILESYAVKSLIERLQGEIKAGRSMFELSHVLESPTVDGKFPDVERVIPKKQEADRSKINSISFSPAYMADVHKAFKEVVEKKGKRHPAITFDFDGAASAIKATLNTAHNYTDKGLQVFSAVTVVMPVRL